jgi:hypothetical protein
MEMRLVGTFHGSISIYSYTSSIYHVSFGIE